MPLSVPTNSDELGPQDWKQVSRSMLHGETNIKSILDVEEQIKEHEAAIVKLKRARNSLLNVSKLPPEVLGDIFRRNVTLEGDFGGLGKESHNFLLVCHYWHEVASSIPELWSFWGNTLKDWARRCRHSGTAPLDLVLEAMHVNETRFFDDTLFEALRDHVDRDTIRRIHLCATDPELLNSIIVVLTAGPKELRPCSVESLILQDENEGEVDVSDFFTHYHFPRLQHLVIYCCFMSSWDLIASRTAVLTTLELIFGFMPDTPTTSQVLSMLASNPTLRIFTLVGYKAAGDGGGNPSPRVSLHYLKNLRLDGNLQGVFGLLDRLDLPKHMDLLDVAAQECKVEDISQTIGPCLQHHLRHCGRSQNGLGLSLSSGGYDIGFKVGDVGGIDFSIPAPASMKTFMEVAIEMDQIHPTDLLEKVTLSLVAYVPREEIVYFQAKRKPAAMEDISAQLPNLRGLHFEKTPLPAAFPKVDVVNPKGDGEIFPSVQYIFLDQVVVSGINCWGPLITFLFRRVWSGTELHSLVIVGSYHTPPDISRGMVQEYRLNPHCATKDA